MRGVLHGRLRNKLPYDSQRFRFANPLPNALIPLWAILAYLTIIAFQKIC